MFKLRKKKQEECDEDCCPECAKRNKHVKMVTIQDGRLECPECRGYRNMPR